MKVIVTGGKGYIGSIISKKLNCDTFDLQDGQDFRNLNHCKVFADYDCVIHLGAIADIGVCENDHELAYETNVTGTKNILRYAKKMIFTSTAAVYGNVDKPVGTGDPTNPINFYGYTKVLAESHVNKANIPTTIFRLFNVHGHDSHSVIDIFKKSEKLKVYGDTWRDFIHVDDVADRIIDELDKIDGTHTYDLGTGVAQSIIKIAEDTGKPVEYLPAKPSDIKYSCSKQ